jgi:hypothetical protein
MHLSVNRQVQSTTTQAEIKALVDGRLLGLLPQLTPSVEHRFLRVVQPGCTLPDMHVYQVTRGRDPPPNCDNGVVYFDVFEPPIRLIDATDGISRDLQAEAFEVYCILYQTLVTGCQQSSRRTLCPLNGASSHGTTFAR